jgi:hypothetical protein
MRSALIQVLVFVAFVVGVSPLAAEERGQVSYEPSVVTLVGTITEEKYDEDAAPIDRGKKAWILRLEQPISVPAKPGDEINVEEKNVTEVHLNVDRNKHPVPKGTFGKTRFAVTGTLYHSHTIHHVRAIVMMVTELKPSGDKPKNP